MSDETIAQDDATMLAPPSDNCEPGDGIVHVLLVSEDDCPRTRLTLGPAPLVIGRTLPSDLIVPDRSVSRQHCRIELANGTVTATDLESTNGTFADGVRMTRPVELRHGSVLRIGPLQIAYERRTRREMEQAAVLDRDRKAANAYVQMLLPKPILSGPVHADWLLIPGATLGGNAFGYRTLGNGLFAGYMLDVAGQGTEATMHSVAVMNMLRVDARSDIDSADPASVLQAVNAAFPHEQHNGLLSMMWYFTLDLVSRRLRYAAAGRRTGFLVAPDRKTVRPLTADGQAIGLSTDARFEVVEVKAALGSALYLLSEGMSELFVENDASEAPERLLALLGIDPQPGMPETLRIYNAAREANAAEEIVSDLCVLVFGFP